MRTYFHAEFCLKLHSVYIEGLTVHHISNGPLSVKDKDMGGVTFEQIKAGQSSN